MRNINIPDKIIHRAVELWCRKLLEPVFDNGDDSFNGFISKSLATFNIETAINEVANLQSNINKFKKVLTANLIKLRDSNEYIHPFLDVDYGPCKILTDAANEAGIPYELFSIKSSVYMGEDHVRVSFGYGGEFVNHYPIDGDKWLITTLTGSDLSKIIDQIVLGNEMGLTIESSNET